MLRKILNLGIILMVTTEILSENGHAQDATRAIPATLAGTGVGREGSTIESKVWHQLFEMTANSPITSDERLQNPQFNKPRAIQPPGMLYIGSYRIDGGQMWLDGEKSLKHVCKGEGANFSLCKEKKPEDLRAWEAAALSFGLPVAALMCIAAEETKPKKDGKKLPVADGPKLIPTTPAQDAANEKQKKRADQVYYRLIGVPMTPAPPGSRGEPTLANPAKELTSEQSKALRSASAFRNRLIKYEPSLLQGATSSLENADFFDIIKMIAISHRNPEVANQLAASGLKEVQVPPDAAEFVKGTMDCLCGAETEVKATGDCKTGVQRRVK